MRELLVATNNPGKLGEFRRLLADLPVRVVSPGGIGLELDVPEPHASYAENATAKARAFCLASGRLTLADDSGIEVAALDWGPGVYSARFGGADVTDNATHLLEQLRGADDRRARMVCWLALAIPASRPGAEPEVELYSGTVDGSVTDERRGDGGFGYDPIFLLPDGRTNAELAAEEKDRLSHRGHAVAAAAPRIRELARWAAAVPDPASD
ncbi:MAG: non-canonical purine NTP pyrophosphatase [Candidatus Limnocylindria bacterium]